MNRRSFCRRGAALLLSLALACPALGAAGDADDPVLSQSYLDAVFSGAFLTQTEQAAGTAADALEADTLRDVEQRLAEVNALRMARGEDSASGAGMLVTAQYDRVTVALGTRVTALEGELRSVGSGWVDITAGEAVAAGTLFRTGHSYLSAEDGCGWETLGQTGSVTWEGVVSRSYAGSVDFGAAATSLQALDLFRGGNGGFELNRAATRTEALVMFLRILGREPAALASTAANPFTDVPDWAARYAAYANAEGLVQGVGEGRYDGSRQVSAQDYVTLLLRALGFREGSDFTWATALDDAVRLGLLSAGERQLLAQTAFTRAQMAWVSWRALMTPNASGKLLLCVLRDAGVVTRAQIAAAIGSGVGARV